MFSRAERAERATTRSTQGSAAEVSKISRSEALQGMPDKRNDMHTLMSITWSNILYKSLHAHLFVAYHLPHIILNQVVDSATAFIDHAICDHNRTVKIERTISAF